MGGGGGVTTDSAAGYTKLTFAVFYRCHLLVLIGLLSSFSSSTGTGTGKENDLVALGIAQSFRGS